MSKPKSVWNRKSKPRSREKGKKSGVGMSVLGRKWEDDQGQPTRNGKRDDLSKSKRATGQC